MVGDAASMESLVKMRTPRESDTAASNDAANKKKKVRISKISQSGSTPMCQTSGSRVKMLIQKLESQQDAGSPGRTNGLDET
jgi:hypothetical protein